MRLILLRHGNTFSPGESAVWVGKSEDLPLVSQGKTQAQVVAGVLSELGVYPDALFCSSLKRTKEFAQILKKTCGWETSVTEDARLDELDYGSWSGLTSEEIAARGFVIDLQQWNDHCVWPADAGWGGSPQLLRAEAQDFVEDVVKTYDDDATVVGVTSNGRLRYFLALDNEAFKRAVASEKVKVKTGHASIFEVSERGVRMVEWNLSPPELAVALSDEK